MHVLSWLGQLVGVFIFVKDQQHLGYADLSWLCRKEVPINYLSKHKRSLFFFVLAADSSSDMFEELYSSKDCFSDVRKPFNRSLKRFLKLLAGPVALLLERLSVFLKNFNGKPCLKKQTWRALRLCSELIFVCENGTKFSHAFVFASCKW